MKGRWDTLWVGVVTVLACVAFIWLMVYRMYLSRLEADRRQAIAQDAEARRLNASLSPLRASVREAERERERAETFLRQDFLVPRALLAIESTVPPGLGIESVAWSTDYAAEGPFVVLDVSGWAATPVQKQAQGAWDLWMRRLGGWQVSLEPWGAPAWSRRRTGEEPSLAFRATFRTPPTPIPPPSRPR